MLTIDRTPIATGNTVTPATLQEHMRLDGDLVYGAYAYSHAAAVEIEAYCDIALLTQTITALSVPWPGPILHLPVGPVAMDAAITVDLLEVDGSYTPITDGWFLQSGTWAKLHFIDNPGGRLRVTYEAGYAATADGIPRDLTMAICDLAARLYDYRASEKTATMPAATARICARYRRVRINA